MNGNAYLLTAVLIAAFVTFLLRVLPFLVFNEQKKIPAVIEAVGKMLPGAVMAMLVVYCLKDTDVRLVSNVLPRVIAVAAVVLTYVWKKNTLFSIILGTVLYMVLVQFVF